MNDVYKFSIVLLVLGLGFTLAGLYGFIDKLNVIIDGRQLNIAPIELVKVNEQKRARGSGPNIYVYNTSEPPLRINSLRKLQSGKEIKCAQIQLRSAPLAKLSCAA